MKTQVLEHRPSRLVTELAVVPVATPDLPVPALPTAERLHGSVERAVAWLTRPGMGAALGYSALFGAGAAYTVTHWSAMAAMDPYFNGLIAAWAVFMSANWVGQRAVGAWSQVNWLDAEAAAAAVRNSERVATAS